MANRKQGKYIIKGLVQGVGFRYFVYRHAVRLGLTGYAKNLFNGSVEVVAVGEEDKLNELTVLLKKGPERSYVESVEMDNSDKERDYSGFGME